MYLMLLLIIMGGTSSAELIMIYDDNYEYIVCNLCEHDR